MANKFNLNSLLNNESMKEAGKDAEKEKSQQMPLKIVQINIHDLVPSKDNFYSIEQIEELKASIEMFGIKQNLVVKPIGNGKYKVIAGHRRRLAALALVKEGKKVFEYVPCVIEHIDNKKLERLLLITTNATTRQLSEWEKIEQAKEMKALLEEYKKSEKLPGRIRDLIAEILNTSSTQIGRMDAIANNLSPEFKKELKAENLNISTAYELSGLPEEEQKEVFKDYREKGNLSIKDIKNKKTELKKKQEIKKINNSTESKEPQKLIGQVAEQVEEKQIKNFKIIFESIKTMDIEQLSGFLCKAYHSTQNIFYTKKNCIDWLKAPMKEE